MRQTAGDTSRSRRLRGEWLAVAVLVGGLALAACSSGSSSTSTTATTASAGTAGNGSGKGLNSLVNGFTGSSNAVFSATYVITQATAGKTETITFAQSPPKSAITTSNGSFYVDGSTVTECQGTGSTANCTILPSSGMGALTALTTLFDPKALATSLKAVESETNVAGYSVRTSSATYGGLASNCVSVKGPSVPSGSTYCGSTSNGVLTYTSGAGNTVTLQSFTANPLASTFAPPAGATVSTLPAGT